MWNIDNDYCMDHTKQTELQGYGLCQKSELRCNEVCWYPTGAAWYVGCCTLYPDRSHRFFGCSIGVSKSLYKLEPVRNPAPTTSTLVLL